MSTTKSHRAGERTQGEAVVFEADFNPDDEYDDRGDCAGNIGEFYLDNPGFRRCDCEDFPCCGH